MSDTTPRPASETGTRRTLRTVVQVVAALAAAAPIVLPALGLPETAAAYAVTLTVAAAVTRVMHAPAVQPVLAWLGLDVKDGAE